MANVVVVGAQWGDEGKGKIVDWLSRAGRCRGPLPGRPQCRPHARHRRQGLQALAAALGRRAAGKALGHRQRRRARSLCARRRGGAPRASRASTITRDNLQIAENVTLILLPPPGTRRPARKQQVGHQDRHDQTRHRPGLRGQGGPARDPPHGSGRPRDAARQDRPPARPSQRRCAAASSSTSSTRRRSTRNSPRVAPEGAALHGRRLAASRRASAGPASASCSRAPRERCSMSTTAPTRS